MRLSPLQRYILRNCYITPPRAVARGGFARFYEAGRARPKDVVDVVTKSLESLIDKGTMVGYGVRTPKKWYIKEVKLTPAGRKLARRLLGEQQAFAFKKVKSSGKS